MADQLSRRALIAGACGMALSTIPALSAEAASAVKKLSDGRLSVRVKDIPALSTVGGSVRIGTVKGVPVAIARSTATTYNAFSLSCPHQGVTVVKSGDKWICNAHGSEFEANGNLSLGPATTGLARVPVRVSRGQVIVG